MMTTIYPLKPGDKVKILVNKAGLNICGEIGIIQSDPLRYLFDSDYYVYYVRLPGRQYSYRFVEDEIELIN